jgi:hypothetical protein
MPAVVQISGIAHRGEHHAAGSIPEDDQGVDSVHTQNEVQGRAVQGIDPMLADHDLARHREHRRVDELHGIADGRFPGVFTRPKHPIAVADLNVPRPEHGCTIADEETRIARRALQRLSLLNHLPVDRMGECTHDGSVKIGDEQRGVLAIQGKGNHETPPRSEYR